MHKASSSTAPVFLWARDTTQVFHFSSVVTSSVGQYPRELYDKP